HVYTRQGCSGTSTKNQTNDDLLGLFIESPEMIEETEETYEGEMPLYEDSVSSFASDNNGVKEGEVFSEELKTTGEIPDKPTANPDERGIYTVADQYPEFPEGSEKMMQFIADNLRYPETCACIQGRVIIKFYIDTLGHVCEPTIYKGLDPDFDAEALRVVKLMPDFKPGKIDGKNVNLWMHVPISFKLSSD
ncbi:MAG: energy transducer TonB, partial [Muribaculaceae bacterium]|nr:energy transducer TonB [Muribaculaceae bacterium]